MTRPLVAVALAILCTVLSTSTVRAEDRSPVVPGFKIAKPPTIDGVIGAEEWAGVPSATAAFDSADGSPATDPMTIWLAYDSQYIYFAARLADRNPSLIQANQYQTNTSLYGDDYVTLGLDVTGTQSAFSRFFMNSRGASNTNLDGGRAGKLEWNGEFITKGRITAQGWEVEARIPWQMLPLPKSGFRDTRFTVTRYVPHLQRGYVFFFEPPDRAGECAIWRHVLVPEREQKRFIKLLPYLYGGYSSNGGHIANAGLDLKAEPMPGVTLVGTVNPDFRDIEDQILSLDFSRFERLAGESRPFFAEGSAYNFSNNIFTSQRIGTVDTGLNAYGHLNDRTKFLVLNTTQYGRENDIFADISLSPDPKGYYSLGVADRSASSAHNTAMELNASRQLGAFTLSTDSAISTDSKQETGGSNTFSGYYQTKTFFGGVNYLYTDDRFAPALGYAPEVNMHGLSTYVGTYRTYKFGPVSSTSVSGTYADLQHLDGSQYRRRQSISGSASLRDHISFNGSMYSEDFEGQHDHLASGSLGYSALDSSRSISLSFSKGSLALVHYNNLSLNASYRHRKDLYTTLSYQINQHDTWQTQLIGSVNYDMHHNLSVSSRLVQNSSGTNIYFSFRRAGNKGVEYYLIVGDPNAVKFQPAFVVKVALPFDIRL